MFRLIPSKVAVYAALTAFVSALLAWLRFDAKRDQRRDTERQTARDNLTAIRTKKEIERNVEAQDDDALIERITRH
jgi:hypothetical protein